MKVWAAAWVWVALWASRAEAAPSGSVEEVLALSGEIPAGSVISVHTATASGEGRDIQQYSGQEVTWDNEVEVDKAIQDLTRSDATVRAARFIAGNINAGPPPTNTFHLPKNHSNFPHSVPASVTIIHSDSGSTNNFQSFPSYANTFNSAPSPANTFGSAPVSTNTFNSAPAPANSFNSAPASVSSFQSAPSPDSSFQSTPVSANTFNSAPAPSSTFISAPASVKIIHSGVTSGSSFQGDPAPSTTFQSAPAPASNHQFTQTSDNTFHSVPPSVDSNSFQSAPASTNSFQSGPASTNLFQYFPAIENSFQSEKTSSNLLQSAPATDNSFQSGPDSINSFQSAPASVNSFQSAPASVNSFQSSPASVHSFQSAPASVNIIQSDVTSDNSFQSAAVYLQSSPALTDTFQSAEFPSDSLSSSPVPANSLSVNRQGLLLGSGEVLHHTEGTVFYADSGEVLGGTDISPDQNLAFGAKNPVQTHDTGLENLVNSGVSLASPGVPFTPSGATGVPLPIGGDISTGTGGLSFDTSVTSDVSVVINSGESGVPQLSTGLSGITHGSSGEINQNFGSTEVIFLSSGENFPSSEAFFGSSEVQLQNTGSSEVHLGTSGVPLPTAVNSGGSFEGSIGGSIGSISSSFTDGNSGGFQINAGSSEVSYGDSAGLSVTASGIPVTPAPGITGASVEDLGTVTKQSDGGAAYSGSSEISTGQLSSSSPSLPATVSSSKLPNGLEMLLNGNAHQIDDPGQTLGSFLMEINGQDGILVLPASSLDAVKNGDIQGAAESASSLSNIDFGSDSEARSESTGDINGFKLDTASTGTSVTVTQASFISSTPVPTNEKVQTTTTRTTTTTTEAPLFRGPLSDLLFAKGQFFGRVLGGMIDLGRTLWTTLMETGVI